jgi:hypothetical protein
MCWAREKNCRDGPFMVARFLPKRLRPYFPGSTSRKKGAARLSHRTIVVAREENLVSISQAYTNPGFGNLRAKVVPEFGSLP